MVQQEGTIPVDKQAKTVWRSLLPGMLGGGLIGAIGTAVAAQAMDAPLRSALYSSGIGRILLLIIFGLIFALVTHELGHLLLGQWVGFRFQFFVVGPLRIERDETERIRLRWNRDLSLYGGVAASYPTDTQDLPARFARVLAGGPLSSLTLSLLAFGLLFLLPFPGIVRLLLGWTGLCCGLIFLGTALPLPNGPFLTDGARFLRLRGGDAMARRDAALLRLIALAGAGIRPGEWDSETLETALHPDDSSLFVCQARFLAYLNALDRAEVAQAGAHLDHALSLLSGLPASMQVLYRCEAVYFEAWHRKRQETAREWLALVPAKSPSLPDYERLRAVAAFQSVQGDREAANRSLQAALQNSPEQAVWSRARLLEMQASLDSHAETKEPFLA